jgi:predicted porin
MRKAIVAGVVLSGYTTFACAYNPGDAADTDPVAAPAASCPGCAYEGEPPGGHDIAVFTGLPAGLPAAVPGLRHGADWPSQRRRGYGRIDETGADGAGNTFILGRQYNLETLSRADVGEPFHSGAAGRASNLVNPDGTPVDSDVRYYSSRMNHVSTGASWTVDTLGGNAAANRSWGLSVGVDYGRFSLRAAHQNRHVAQVQLYNLAGNNMDAKNSIIAANLRSRWGTAYAAYAANRGWGASPLYNPDNPYGAGVASTSSTDSRDILVGIAMPLSHATTFLASLIRKNDRDLSNRDARQLAVGASYVLSRKTDFYAAISHTMITDGNGIVIGGAARPSGSSAINVGMRHAF